MSSKPRKRVCRYMRTGLVSPSGNCLVSPATFLEAFYHVDEIWAPTRFIQAGLGASIDLPVVHIPVALPSRR